MGRYGNTEAETDEQGKPAAPGISSLQQARDFLRRALQRRKKPALHVRRLQPRVADADANRGDHTAAAIPDRYPDGAKADLKFLVHRREAEPRRLFHQLLELDAIRYGERHVPYKRSAPALNDLLAGQVHMAFDNMTTVWPHAQGGRLRALGVAGQERSPAAPDVPAIAEALPGFEANSWVGFFGPAGLSQQVAQSFAAATRRALDAPEVAKKLRELGASPAASSPKEFAAFVRNDTERWRKVAQAAKISLD